MPESRTPQWLLDELSRLDEELPEKKLPAAGDTLSEKEAGGSSRKGISIDGMALSRALKNLGGDEAALINVLRSYAAETRKLLRNMEGDLAAGNLPGYEIAVHGIKGTSKFLCALEIGRMAEELERAAGAGDLGRVRDGHQTFARTAEALLGRIDAALGERSAAAPKPAATAPDLALLRLLCDACAAFDMSEADAAMERLEVFRYERGEELVAWLREKINAVAFEEIAAIPLPPRVAPISNL